MENAVIALHTTKGAVNFQRASFRKKQKHLMIAAYHA